MNRYIRKAFFYLILGLLAGLFYREFTRSNGVDGGTTLSLIHGHLLLLGTVVHLVLALFEERLAMSTYKSFKFFNIFYNAGLLTTVGIFLIRGITDVLGKVPGTGLDKALSGVAGLGHISLSVGFIVIFLILNKASLNKYEDFFLPLCLTNC